MAARERLGRVGIWSSLWTLAAQSGDPDPRTAEADAAAELDDLGYGAIWLAALLEAELPADGLGDRAAGLAPPLAVHDHVDPLVVERHQPRQLLRIGERLEVCPRQVGDPVHRVVRGLALVCTGGVRRGGLQVGEDVLPRQVEARHQARLEHQRRPNA